MALSVGSGRVEVTPRKPLFLVGYPHVERISTGVHDPLYATALCLDDGGQAILLISVDIICLPHPFTGACREHLQEATGIPPEHILISCTHTHSGPVTQSMVSWNRDGVVPPPDEAYLDEVLEGIVGAGREAHASRQPAEIAVASVDIEGVGRNRLDPDGPRDPQVGILYARRREDGSPLAVHMVYAMHPTVLHEDSTVISGDFPGFARAVLEEALPGARVAYHMGTAGNQSPRYDVRGQTLAEAERLGGRLGQAVLKRIQSLDAQDFSNAARVTGRAGRAEVPFRNFPSLAVAGERYDAAVAEYERLKAEGAPHGPVRTAECVTFGAEEVMALAEAQASGELAAIHDAYRHAEVVVLQVGNHALVGMPCELFVEYGLEIKRRAALPSMVISLANGELQGYIVTPEAEQQGGYEAFNSMATAETGARLVNTALKLIAEGAGS